VELHKFNKEHKNNRNNLVQMVLRRIPVLFNKELHKFGLVHILPSQYAVFTLGSMQLVPMLATLDCGMLVPKTDSL
jgi:hypothetical protein